MSTLTDFIESKLLPDEKLLSVNDDIYIGLSYVPYPFRFDDKMDYQAAVANTTDRLLIIYIDGWKCFCLIQMRSLHLIEERFIKSAVLDPTRFQFPYRAELYTSGGLLITIQTSKEKITDQKEKMIDLERQEKLSRLLSEAYIRFGGHLNGDTNAEVAIQAAREEEKRRRN